MKAQFSTFNFLLADKLADFDLKFQIGKSKALMIEIKSKSIEF